MRIAIVAAGKLKEPYLRKGAAEFLKRLAPYVRLDVVEIDEEKMPERPSKAEKEQTLTREGRRLLRQMPDGAYCIALDVMGKNLSSEELAAHIEELGVHGKSVVAFLIGGPFGLSEEVRAAADERLSFSRMTFTHQMVRLLLLEQIYRAYKINRGEKYHW